MIEHEEVLDFDSITALCELLDMENTYRQVLQARNELARSTYKQKHFRRDLERPITLIVTLAGRCVRVSVEVNNEQVWPTHDLKDDVDRWYPFEEFLPRLRKGQQIFEARKIMEHP